ncbi:hypothetical protein Ttaiw_01874 [Tepidimonas taiwanensis]|uniref:Uncharacterized protein n=1 Tax=Tepidimonas taiwanensis TaxID=307486 RepID=A0A554X3R0_9BURK|nr:hypothetical protein [Tepidimonas taiwanensis]TSE30480.1 hypothetical protein Ttaiw_01874 [Tepidimonas taiwanensis]
MHFAGDLEGGIYARIRQPQREFLATQAHHGVATANTISHAASQTHQHLVTDIVTKFIVDFFEVVDIDKQ